MYMTHPLLALLATIISPLNYFIVKRAGYLSGLYGVVQNAALAESNQVAVEALGAVRTVQANTGEVGEARFFASNINRFLRVVLVTVITQTVVIFTQLGLSKARDVLVLGYGMWEVITGTGANRLTIGSFTAFNTYVNLYEQGFSSIANIWINLRQALHPLDTYRSICARPSLASGEALTTPPLTTSPPPTPNPSPSPAHPTPPPTPPPPPAAHLLRALARSSPHHHPTTLPGPRLGREIPPAHGPNPCHRRRCGPHTLLVPRGARVARCLLPLPRRHRHGEGA